MNCDEARERMIFHADGEDAEVGAHVRACAACRAERDRAVRERASLKRAIRLDVVPRYVPKRRIPWIPFVVAAAAVLVVVIGMRAFRRDDPPPPRKEVVKKKETVPPPKEEKARFEHPWIGPTPPREEEFVRPPEKKEEKPPEEKKEEEVVKPKEEKKPETKPEEKVVEVALTLEKGTAWKGTKTFPSGETIRAKGALRIAWGGATVYVKEESTITILEKDALAIESGAVLVENFGGSFSIRAGEGTIRDLGTRLLVTHERGRTEAVVFEGRAACGDVEIEAGDRLSYKGAETPKVEPMRDRSYPAWMSRVWAKRSALVSFAFQGKEKFALRGVARDGLLWGEDKEGQLYTGVESESGMFVVPREGEFWVTYHTEAPDPITFRCRARKAESVAFDFVLEKPVVGRAVQVRIPLSKFRSFEKQPLAAGDPIHILYIFTPNLKARLRIDDLAIVDVRE